MLLPLYYLCPSAELFIGDISVFALNGGCIYFEEEKYSDNH